jgi:two-component system OmpR family response regulator
VPPRILIIEDEANVAYIVVTALGLAGFDTVEAVNGRDGLRLARTDHCLALIIADVMMPGIDGFEFYRRLRDCGVKVPVIFLTARDGLNDRIEGLGLGADDYLTKPFNVEKLVARVRASLRLAGELPRSPVLTCGDLTLDDNTYRVVRGQKEIDLSPTEYRMLRLLISNAGNVMSKAQIRDYVWDYGFSGEMTAVETFISSLRRKVDTEPPHLIHTVRGIGYRMESY